MSQSTASRWAAIPLALYFLHFAAGALRARFAVDDPMNLGFYWMRGLLHSAGDVITFWNNSYRPMAALFYLPIYHFFGVNPLPYRIAILALVALNIFLSYRIALRLTGLTSAAMLTAALVCAHAGMTPIYYNTSQIYDVLAFLFTALTLDLYMRARQRGGPDLFESVLIVAAFLAALNSKEIAVVGAIWVLAYELLLERASKLRIPAILIVLAIAYTLTRALGPHSLSTQVHYRLEFSAHRFFVNAKTYLDDLFFTERFNTDAKVIGAWVLGTVFCAIARKRELWWTWIVVSTATLPVIFTIEPRSGASLYLPLLGFALWMACAATIFFRDQPIRQWSMAALVSLLMIPATLKYWNDNAAWLIREQQAPWSALTQIRDLPSRPAPHSTVLFLNNPFPDWDIWFMAMLVWDDHTLDVKLADKIKPPPDPATFDWVLAFDDDHLRVIRSP